MKPFPVKYKGKERFVGSVRLKCCTKFLDFLSRESTLGGAGSFASGQ